MAVRIKRSNEWGSVAPGQIKPAWIVYGIDGGGMGHFVTFLGLFLIKTEAEKLLANSLVRMEECEVIGTNDGGVRILGNYSGRVNGTVTLGPVDESERTRLRALAKLSKEEREALGLE